MVSNTFSVRFGLTVANTLLTAENNKVGVNTASPSVTFHVSSNDAIMLPAGNTAQRPTAANGMLRYNSDTTTLEVHANGAWGSITDDATATSNTFVSNSTALSVVAGGSNVIVANSTALFVIAGGSNVIVANSTVTSIKANNTDAIFANSTALIIYAVGGQIANSVSNTNLNTTNINAVSVSVSGTSVINSSAGLINISAIDAVTANTIQNNITVTRTPTINVFTSSGTYVKPAGLLGVKVTVIGGGGRGNQTTDNPNDPSPPDVNVFGGGAGGGSIEYIPAPSIPGPQVVTVGAGGTPSPVNGGTSSFGAFLSATGGAGEPGPAAGGAGSGGNINVTGQEGTSTTSSDAPLSTVRAAAGVFGFGFGNSSPSGTPGFGGGGMGAPPGVNRGGQPGVVIIEEFY